MRKNKKIALSAMFLSLALVLPFLTGQIKQIGNALCPMHIPVILCGFLCGPWYGLVIGFTAPLLRFLLFGMPAIIPSGLAMSFELGTYGLVSGLMYRKRGVYFSLITAMISGRLVWGLVRVVMYGLMQYSFGWKLFFAGAFLNSVPGIILQIILIPILVKEVKNVQKT